MASGYRSVGGPGGGVGSTGHLPSHRDLLHIAGMGSALGVGFPPNMQQQQQEEQKVSSNAVGSDILDAKKHDLR